MRRFLMLACLAAVLVVIVQQNGCMQSPNSTLAWVQGQAFKGTFTLGTALQASEISTPFRTANGTITDVGSNFSVITPWSGPTTVSISGNFRDDFTGQTTTQPGATPLLAVYNLPASRDLARFNGQINLATSIAAQALLNYQAASPTQQITATHVGYFNQLAAQQILGLTTSATDISQVILQNTGDPNATQTVAFQIAVASLTGSAFTASAVTQLANNIGAGLPLGGTPTNGLPAPFTSAQLQTALNAVAAGGNISYAGQAPGSVALSTVLANLGTGQTVAQMQSQTVPANVYTALRGFAFSGNTLTIGASTGTVAITNGQGQATMTGSTARGNLAIGFTLRDYSNGTGTGPAGATTYATTFSFGLVPAQGSSDIRTLMGMVSPIQVSTNGSGGLTLSIPSTATMTLSGLTTSGAFVGPTNTTVPAGFMTAGSATSTGTPITINLNTLLAQVQTVFTTQAQVLNLAGTYNIGIGFSIPVGIDQTGGGALATPQLLPQGTAANWTLGYTVVAPLTLT